jgi:hypothetical protein
VFQNVSRSQWKGFFVAISAALLFALNANAQPNYGYQRTITIDHTKVPNTDQANFPLLFYSTDPLLKSTGNGGHVNSPSGYDIIFTSDAAGTQKLNHEIESYNASNGQCIAWVRIPVLSHTANTVIYLFYGNSSITTSQENKTGVWDNNYLGVWHFSEDPNGAAPQFKDSTSNAKHMATAASTNGVRTSSMSSVPGQIGNAFFANESDEYHGYYAFATLPSGKGTNGATIEGWVKFPSLFATDGSEHIFGTPPGSYPYSALELEVKDDGTIFGIFGTESYAATGPIVSTNAFHHLALTYNGNSSFVPATGILYVDGVAVASSTNYEEALDNTAFSLGDGTPRLQKTQFDELRLSNTVRSADWISTGYNNQSSPGTFYGLGSETPVPVPITVTSAPNGRALTVDGQACASTPCPYNWTPGSSHTIAVTSTTQAGAAGTQYVFANWSDGGAASHTVTGSSSAATYTANFTTQYQLTTTATSGGTIGPASGGWYNSGSVVAVSATANSGYTFSGFSGALTGATTPQNLTMSAPASVNANFNPIGGGSSSYTYSRAITIDHTKVPSTDQANFPFLFNTADPLLKSTAYGGHVNSASGYDIIFTSDAAGAQKLDHEIDSYNAATGQFTAWVRIPALSHTTNTVIYQFYGNAAISSSQENKTGVWDSNYKSVWHFSEDPNGAAPQFKDSTSNAKHMTTAASTNGVRTSSMSSVPGQIGNAFFANESDEYHGYYASATLPSGKGTNGATIEGWVKFPSLFATDGSEYLFGTLSGSYPYSALVLQVKDDGTIFGSFGSEAYSATGTIVSTNVFHHVALTYNGTPAGGPYTGILYIDGVAAASSTNNQGALDNTAFSLGDGSPRLQKTQFDELRLSNTVRSPDWIATGYNNQASPTTFYGLGSEIPSGGTVPITVTSAPAGRALTVDAQQACASTPCTYNWTPGSSHTIAVTSTQAGAAGTQYVFASWSDGGAASHTVTGSSSAATYTANFTTQYQLTTTATSGGTINPASGGWYNSGSVVAVSATANSGYTFSGFSGALTGATTPQNLTMNAPASVTAIFNPPTTTYSRAITIDHTKVPNTDQANFPFLFNTTDPLLKSSAYGGHVNSASGYDIIFTSDPAGTQKLDHEIDSYNPASGQFAAWVRIPALSHTTNTTIYLFYGNSGITSSQENKTGVWDSYYKSVWHFSEDPNGAAPQFKDSTSNAKHMTTMPSPNGVRTSTMSTVPGQIGNAFYANESDEYHGYYAAATLPSGKGTNGATIEGWVKFPSLFASDGNGEYLFGTLAGSYPYSALLLSVKDDGTIYGTFGTETYTATGPIVSTNVFHHVALTYNGNTSFVPATGILYVDGIAVASSTNYEQALDNTAFSLGDGSPRLQKTQFDELRLSNTVRSPDWIATGYNNQASPATFYGLGPETGGPPPPPPPVTVTVNTAPGGRSFTVDGQTYTTQQTFQWPSGSSHSIGVTSATQAGAAGTQYVFANWSDGGAASHTVTGPSSPTTYTANFTTQYQLTTAASPAAGGTISPASGGWYNSASLIAVSATANSGYTFSGFSGALTGATTPQNLTLNAPAAVTANFAAVTESITVNTSPTGLTVTVDGLSCAPAPCTYQWTAGSSHTIAAASAPQSGGSGTQFVFANWSDSGAASHSIAVPQSAASFTATFTAQYYLTTAASPASGGAISPASAWYNSGSVVAVSVTANSGYSFSGFSGALTGATTPQNLTLNAPATVTANFAAVTESITVNTSPPGLTITVDGASCAPAPCSYQWATGSNHTLVVPTAPEAGGSGTQFVFSNWSDGGTASHQVTTPAAAATYTATFTTQYQLTTSVNPAGAGTLNPSTGWHNSGATVGLVATSNSGYYFTALSGAVSGVSPQTITITGPASVTANFSPLTAITVSSAPSGLSVTVDGVLCAAAPCTYQWIPASTHVIAPAPGTQPGTLGTQYVFSSWSDSGPATHNVTAPPTATQYLATFNTQYYLTTTTNPTAGGTISPPGGWHNVGEVVTLSATPNSGYTFVGFTGPPLSGTPPQNLTVSAPAAVAANFSQAPVAVTVTTSPGGLQVTADGAVCSAAPCVYQWIPGTSHNIGVSTTTQPGSTGTQYLYSSWSDGGGQTHPVTAPSGAFTYTAAFTTQYLLTTNVNYPSLGSISPASGWYPSGSSVQVSGTAVVGYAFAYFTGALQGTAASQTLTMTGPANVTANIVQPYFLYNPVQAITIQANPSGTTVNVPVTMSQYYGFSGSLNIVTAVNSNQLTSPGLIANFLNGGSGQVSSALTLQITAYSPSPDGLPYLVQFQGHTGTGGSAPQLFETSYMYVTVTPGNPTFTMNSIPSQSLAAGQAVNGIPISVTPRNNFNSPVSFSLIGETLDGNSSGGISVSFGPANPPSNFGATVNLSTTAATLPGLYQLTFSGTSGSTSVRAVMWVTVTLTANTAPDFYLSPIPGLSVFPSGSGAAAETITPVNGFNFSQTPVGFSWTMPPGWPQPVLSQNPTTTGSTTVTVTPPAGAQPGSYTLPFTASGGGASHPGTLVVNVQNPASAPPQPFAVSCSASPATVTVGQIAIFFATPAGGAGPYTYSWSVSGSGVVSGSNPFLPFYAQSTGTYQASVTATDSNNQVALASCLLDVEAVGSNFTISATPNTASASPGSTVVYKVTVTSVNGFTGTVNLDVTGLPAGATYPPTSIVGGSGTANLFVTTPASVQQNGPYSLTITGSSGTVGYRSTNAILNLSAASPVRTAEYDQNRTGANVNEFILTPDNVLTPPNVTDKFGYLWSYPVDGCVYAHPLYVPGVVINHQVKNVVYIATTNNTVYAYDADSSNLLWSSLANPYPVARKSPDGYPDYDVADCATGQTTGPLGIIGTPAIGPDGAMWFVTGDKDSGQYVLRSLDITNGNQLTSTPISAQPPLGPAFNYTYQTQRPGLLVDQNNTYVSVGFASQRDVGTYQGWVLTYLTGTGTLIGATDLAPISGGAGVWMSGGGIAADGQSMYFTTGNGASRAQPDYANAIVQIPNNGIPVDGNPPVAAFIDPHYDDSDDRDFGSSRAILAPPNYLITGSKVGNLYILDRTYPISYTSSLLNQVRICNRDGDHFGDHDYWAFYNGFAFWNGTVYTWCSSDTLNAYNLSNLRSLSSPLQQNQSGSSKSSYQGANIAISANGNLNGIVWATFPDDPHAQFATGRLLAYNAANWDFSQTLYSSTLNGLNFQKFTPPVIAAGRVYVATASRQVLVYGLGGR